MIGRTVGRYAVTEALGDDALGSVWVAEDTLLRRRVTLRLLAPRLAGDEASRARFLREARAASTLDHPGIATIYDVGEMDGHVYVASQRVEGKTLREKLQGGRLPVDKAVGIGLQIARALEHAHFRGVVHGQVTSESVVLTGSGQAAVIDLAQPDGREEEGDIRSDIRGLGAVLYEMLTGEPPGPATGGNEVPPPSAHRQGIPPELDVTVQRALSRDRNVQPASCSEIAAVLAAHEIKTAPQPGFPRHRRGRRLAITGLAAVLVAMAALIWFGVPFSGRSKPNHDLSATGGDIRVAILPFENLSEDRRRTDYLVKGLTESLITRLSQIPEIRVTPWITARRYAAREDMSPAKVAGELGVDWLVLGSVENRDDHVLASISVIEPGDGMQTWGDEVDVPFADIVAVQRRIVTDLARSLKGKLTGADEAILEKSPTRSPEAYNAYLRGQSLLGREDTVSAGIAEALFTKAIELDPEFDLAYVGRGSIRSGRYYRGDGGVEDLALAEADFRQALALDPDLSVAHRGLIHVFWVAGRRRECLDQAMEVQRRGLDDVDGVLARATAYMMSGMPEEAVPLLHLVLDLDQANAGAQFLLIVSLAWAGEHEEAVQMGRNYLARFGEDGELLYWMATSRQSQGQLGPARDFYDAANRILLAGPNNSYFLDTYGMLLDQMGEPEAARAAWQQGLSLTGQKLDEHPDNTRLRSFHAVYAGLLGDRETLDEEVRRIMAERPAEPELTSIATAHAYHGRTKEALRLLRNRLHQAGPLAVEWQKGWLNIYSGSRLEEREDFQPYYAELEEALERQRRRYGLAGEQQP